MCGITSLKLVIPRVIDLIGCPRETVELCVKLGTIVFWNVPTAPEDQVTAVVGYTYDRKTFSGPDLAVMAKQLELTGGTGQFVLILPTGCRAAGNWPDVKIAFSDALVYPDGKHGDAILMIENHPGAHEAQHIAVARAFEIA